MNRTAVFAFVVTGLTMVSSVTPLAAQNGVNGGNGTIYMGTYAKSIYAIDEATFTVQRKIPLRNGIPAALILSPDRTRFYVLDVTFEHIEVVDIAEGRSIDSFSLSAGDRTVRIWGFNVDPSETYAILVTVAYRKLDDRYEVSPYTLLRYDLTTHTVTDTIPWPGDEERDRARIIFSPDGHLAYFFADDILALDTEDFREVDRWELSEPLEPGFGRFSFGFPTDLYEEPGYYTGMFRVTDPVQNRRLMGVARVNLAERDVDFYLLGPSEGVSFTVAPDRRKAYGLHQEVGNYQMWTFDLVNRRVESKQPFSGRPRMGLRVSSNGQLLYIYNAGNTIDIHRADTFERLRRIEFDTDMTSFTILPGR